MLPFWDRSLVISGASTCAARSRTDRSLSSFVKELIHQIDLSKKMSEADNKIVVIVHYDQKCRLTDNWNQFKNTRK